MNSAATTKSAVVILSDPSSGSDEALGRVFNALAVAYDFDTAGQEVRLQFQGAGTRWPEVLGSPTHPAHELYEAVRHTVAGMSCGCADLFGSSATAATSGLDLINDNSVPGTSGVASLRALVDAGFTVLTF